MKLASLFSGGKDSAYAMYKASKHHDIVCLITIRSENEESYMFHTPNIDLTKMQAKAMGIPLITKTTKGIKEKELTDLKEAIEEAREKYGIEGVVTGAVGSVYQSSRIQKICNELDLWCFNPLWQMDQIDLLKELLENDFEIIIIGVYAYPLDENWLGRKIDKKTIKELEKLQEKYEINPAGEGGETESLVTDAPMFKKKIRLVEIKKEYGSHSGTLHVLDAELV